MRKDDIGLAAEITGTAPRAAILLLALDRPGDGGQVVDRIGRLTGLPESTNRAYRSEGMRECRRSKLVAVHEDGTCSLTERGEKKRSELSGALLMPEIARKDYDGGAGLAEIAKKLDLSVDLVCRILEGRVRYDKGGPSSAEIAALHCINRVGRVKNLVSCLALELRESYYLCRRIRARLRTLGLIDRNDVLTAKGKKELEK